MNAPTEREQMLLMYLGEAMGANKNALKGDFEKDVETIFHQGLSGISVDLLTVTLALDKSSDVDINLVACTVSDIRNRLDLSRELYDMVTFERKEQAPKNGDDDDDVLSGVKLAREVLNLLVREAGPALADICVTEERPTEGELPEQGRSRYVRALEVVARALTYLTHAEDMYRGSLRKEQPKGSEAAE